MVTISLLKSVMSIKREIMMCLDCASSQGLHSDNICIDVNTSEWITIKTSQHEIKIVSDLFGIVQPHTQYDYRLNYKHIRCDSISVDCLDIYIGVKCTTSGRSHHQDVWLQSTDSSREGVIYSSTSTSKQANIQHLSWFITLISLDFSFEDALVIARSALSAADRVSRETSFCEDIGPTTWPTNYSDFPQLIANQTLSNQESCTPYEESGFPHIAQARFGLYPVVDDVSWIKKLLPLGIKIIQLRIKGNERKDLEHQIITAIQLGREYNAMVFINDHWQLAIKHGAFGVHLGQEDMEKVDLTRLLESGTHLGISSHGYHEVLRAISFKPSYLALGHIFATTTKQMPSQPQGLAKLKIYQSLISSIQWTSKVQSIPTVAIGGIDLSNASDVMNCGVSCFAVVRAITLSQSLEDDIEKLHNLSFREPHKSFQKRGLHDAIK